MKIKYKNSKKDRIYQIFITTPYKILNKREICGIFNSKYKDNIDFSNASKWLSVLFKERKILRTNTQITNGYVYTLKNQNELDKLYYNYLLPYKFDNKKELLSLILQNSFEKLNTNFKINHAKEIFLTKLVAFVMGDGHISKNKNKTLFFFKEKIDAIIFKKDFKKQFPEIKISVIKTDYCYGCIIYNKQLAELLNKLGAPAGNKVFQQFHVPDWILQGSEKIKLAFLSVIYGNEGSKPQDNRWRIQFVLSKNKENVQNLLIFLNQIRAMLNHFGITSTFIQLRKQKNRQFCGRFYIKGKQNLHRFYKLLEFSYASEKQQVLNSLIKGENSLQSATVQ